MLPRTREVISRATSRHRRRSEFFKTDKSSTCWNGIRLKDGIRRQLQRTSPTPSTGSVFLPGRTRARSLQLHTEIAETRSHNIDCFQFFNRIGVMCRTLSAGLTIVLLFSATSLAFCAGDARLADAVMRADRNAVRSLLQQKADVNATQADGMTALHWAVRQNDLETAQVLLRAGAKPDVATRYSVTPLYFACENGNAPLIDLLLRAGVSPNFANSGGETALM